MRLAHLIARIQKRGAAVAVLLAGGSAMLLAAAQAPAPAPAPAPIAFSASVPADIADPGDPQQAATFAWQEFIALTWPAAVNPSPAPGMSPYLRGQPSASSVSGGTGPDGVTVWETFYHRVELYPSYSVANQTLPDPNAVPSYLYRTPITKATPSTSLTLFNNLDEASEIGLAQMYHTPLAAKAQALMNQYPNPTPAQAQQIAAAATRASLLYEAKANPTIFNYVKTNKYNNIGQRGIALRQASNLIKNAPVTGPAFSLPTGSIEIKATWRRYDSSADDLNAFHWTKGLFYTTGANGAIVANNDILLLVGLHIIHKTPNVPTFTFATFEHVSNEANGFRFVNNNPRSYTPTGFPRALPDKGVIQAIRQFPIPGPGSAFDLVGFNKAVQAQIRSQFGASNVWANYQLIGVQALVQNDPGGKVPAQQFFLSNFATETNDTLQFFQGNLLPAGNVPNPDNPGVFTLNAATGKYEGRTAGGCLGCHGAAGQTPGGDFSVISATGNKFKPEPITPYPGGPVVKQNGAGFPLPHQPTAGKTTKKGG